MMSLAPHWLNHAFIEECLRSHTPNETIHVQTLEFLPAPIKGENFLSSIIRLIVSYRENDTSQVHTKRLICKLGLEDEKARDKVTALQIYDKEMHMYQYVLPQIKLLLQRIDADEHMFAVAIRVARDRDAILFEDLGVHGFAMSKRQSGFDVVYARRILANLAKFHAASAVLSETQPDVVERIRNGTF